jgi:hypothetical protein
METGVVVTMTPGVTLKVIGPLGRPSMLGKINGGSGSVVS